MTDIVEELEAHMGKAEVPDLLRDCRKAASEITRLREELRAATERAEKADRTYRTVMGKMADGVAGVERDRDEARAKLTAAEARIEEMAAELARVTGEYELAAEGRAAFAARALACAPPAPSDALNVAVEALEEAEAEIHTPDNMSREATRVLAVVRSAIAALKG